MCGIFFCVSSCAHIELNAEDEKRLRARGPDAFQTHATTVESGSHRWHLTFTSSVLALRGDRAVSQPIVDNATGSVFCWNGEAWSYDSIAVSGNDTEILSGRLFDAVQQHGDPEPAILEILSKITGPYAFMFFDAKSSKVYFGRDSLGRRSLLTQNDVAEDTKLTVCSILMSTINGPAREVETLNVHKIDLKQPKLEIEAIPSTIPPPQINTIVPSDNDVIESTPSQSAIAALIDQLKSSLRPRVKDIPTFTTYGEAQNPSRVAVLFSGGLDCTLLARLVHDILPYDQPVDLLNVAFENPRVNAAKTKQAPKEYDYLSCPDRGTGLKSYQELATVCHERTWRFVCIDIPYAEFLSHRSTIIQLMHPHNTEMDLSIAAALYFAARGQGTLQSSDQPTPTPTPNTPQEHTPAPAHSYTTTARVLLSGLGADELFAGYSRHASAFTRGSYPTLLSELHLDFTRIGTRNLGRDDRVLSHFGRETRFPYLDEQFVKFALSLPVWEKCGFRVGKVVPKHFEDVRVAEKMEELHPEKMLLRCVACTLGMRGVAGEKKRAIQFGARSAKMVDSRSKGTDLVVDC